MYYIRIVSKAAQSLPISNPVSYHDIYSFQRDTKQSDKEGGLRWLHMRSAKRFSSLETSGFVSGTDCILIR